MDMHSLYSALAGAGLPSIACIILCWLVWRQMVSDSAARKRLEEKVNELETEKFRRIETRLDRHISEDKSQQILTQMNVINGTLEKLSAQISRVLESDAGQSRDIENNKQYISNLREDLQTHVRECSMRRK